MGRVATDSFVFFQKSCTGFRFCLFCILYFREGAREITFSVADIILWHTLNENWNLFLCSYQHVELSFCISLKQDMQIHKEILSPIKLLVLTFSFLNNELLLMVIIVTIAGIRCVLSSEKKN